MRCSGQKGPYSSRQGHGPNVVDHGGEGLEDVEGADDQDGQKQGIVVEDAEGGGLVLGNLVLLPQNPLVLFLARDLFVNRIQLEIEKMIQLKVMVID